MGWRIIKGEGVRNLHPFVVTCDEKWNWFKGGNGAGKTSFLECVSMLGTGRSFRSTQGQKVLGLGKDRLVVYGESFDGRHRIGLQRWEDGRVEIAVNGERAQRLQGLGEISAIKVIEPDVLESIEGASVERRRSLEWLMFHVEHHSKATLSRYKRALAQRNAWLRENRGGGDRGTPFDEALVVAGEALADQMETWGQRVLGRFREIVEPNMELAFRWRSGWRHGVSLGDALTASFETDLHRGFTQCGPHRADFDVLVDGRSLRTGHWSRGELKCFSILWQLACALCLEEHKDVTLLLDDIFAELDESRLALLLDVLGVLRAQCFLTGVDIPDHVVNKMGMEGKWFHVEHGKITSAS